MRTSWIISIALLTALGVVSCGPEESSPAALQSELSANSGEILLTRTQQLGERDEEQVQDAFFISARFVRVRDLGRHEVSSLWSQGLSLAEVELNECQHLDVPSSGEQMLGGSLDLLDAGELTLSVGDQVARIPDWNFPSVYGVVAGVAYGSDEALELGFQPEQDYRLEGSGSDEISAFDVSIRAPAELAGVTVAGVEANGTPITLESSGSLEVRWEPGDEGGGDVLVELAFAQFSTEERVICRSRDDGHLEVPAHVAARLWEAGVSEARLVIHRVRRQPFRADGLEEAEALFVVVLTIPLQLP